MNNSPIPLNPDIPEEIIQEANENRLAVFIGAGVSRLIGCLGWSDLSKKLARICLEIKKGDGNSILTEDELEILCDEEKYGKDNKKIITICHDLLVNNGNEDVFLREMEIALQGNAEKIREMDIYRELIGFRALFLTTNADTLFHDFFISKNIAFRDEDFDCERINRNKLYHIHGVITETDSLIFTIPQYINKYNNEKFKEFLIHVFNNFTVLFIGYGLAEFEIFDYLMTKAKEKDSENNLKSFQHFYLKPYKRNEFREFKFDKIYFKSLEIKLIGFTTDKDGDNTHHEELYTILKKWNNRINLLTEYIPDTFKILEDSIKLFSDDKVLNVLQLIKNDKSHENHFFRELSKAEEPDLWLEILYRNGYFNADLNPEPIESAEDKGYYRINYWNTLDYLENVSLKSIENPNNQINNILLRIADSIIEYRNIDGERIDNYITDRSILRIIFNLPLEQINETHIDYLHVALNTGFSNLFIVNTLLENVLPSLFEKKAKEYIVKVLDISLDFSERKYEKNKRFVSVLNNYYLKDLINRFFDSIIDLCRTDIISIVIDIIQKIIELDPTAFKGSIPSIEKSDQSEFANEYQYLLVGLIRDLLESSLTPEIMAVISNLIVQEHSIFKRIAFHTITINYSDTKEFLWNLKYNPLEDMFLFHEVYVLFKENCEQFNETEIDTIIRWIEERDYSSYISEDNEEISQQRIATRKKEILSSLLETKNHKILELFERNNKIADGKIEHPEFPIWRSSVRFMGEIANEVDYFKDLSSERIVDLIIKETDSIEDQFTLQELHKGFEFHITKNIDKIAKDMKPFLKLPLSFQFELLLGFSNNWFEKNYVPWRELLIYIQNLFSSDCFISLKEKKLTSEKSRDILFIVANLMDEGSAAKDSDLDPSYLSQIENILFWMIEFIEEVEYDWREISVSIENSFEGKIFSALLNYSLRLNRLEETKGIPQNIKEYFNNLLEKRERELVSFYFMIGNFYPYLYQIDSEWIKSMVSDIFPDNESMFEAAITGVFNIGRVFREPYLLMKNMQVLEKAISHDFKSEKAKIKLTQQIVYGYIIDLIGLEEKSSLMIQLIQTGDSVIVYEIVHYIWMLRDKYGSKIKKKIISLWKCMMKEILVHKDKDEFQEIIFDLHRWIPFIEKIDEETFELLMISASFAKQEYYLPFFIEYLANHVNITPNYVGRIFMRILERDVFPTFDVKNIDKIIECLFMGNEEKLAKSICNLYLQKNNYVISNICEKYTQKPE